MLARGLGNAAAEVIEVLDDNRLKIKKEFNKKVTEGLKLKPEGSTYKVSISPIDLNHRGFLNHIFGTRKKRGNQETDLCL